MRYGFVPFGRKMRRVTRHVQPFCGCTYGIGSHGLFAPLSLVFATHCTYTEWTLFTRFTACFRSTTPAARCITSYRYNNERERSSISLCLLPFHDTRPLFVLTLLAGTAIKETERWVETLAVLRTHSLQLSAYYHHVLEYVCSLTYLLNHLRPLCVMVSYHLGEKWDALHVTYEPFAAVRYRQSRPVRPLSLVLATHCTYNEWRPYLQSLLREREVTRYIIEAYIIISTIQKRHLK